MGQAAPPGPVAPRSGPEGRCRSPGRQTRRPRPGSTAPSRPIRRPPRPGRPSPASPDRRGGGRARLRRRGSGRPGCVRAATPRRRQPRLLAEWRRRQAAVGTTAVRSSRHSNRAVSWVSPAARRAASSISPASEPSCGSAIAAAQQVAVAENQGQQIVEIVRHPALLVGRGLQLPIEGDPLDGRPEPAAEFFPHLEVRPGEALAVAPVAAANQPRVAPPATIGATSSDPAPRRARRAPTIVSPASSSASSADWAPPPPG